MGFDKLSMNYSSNCQTKAGSLVEVQAEVRPESGSGVMSLEKATVWADFGFMILYARAAPLYRVPWGTG